MVKHFSDNSALRMGGNQRSSRLGYYKIVSETNDGWECTEPSATWR